MLARIRQSHSFLFFLAFGVGTLAIVPLASRQLHLVATLSGISVLLLHWTVTAQASAPPRDRDAEIADSSYFLGFLLTLVFLSTGLWSLGDHQADNSKLLYPFLSDLGAGLALTIAGLAIRQIRVLSIEVSATDTESAPQAAADSWSEATDTLRDIAKSLAIRVDTTTEQQFNESRRRARDSMAELEREFATVHRRILSALSSLDSSVSGTAETLTRTASSLGDSLVAVSERVQLQVSDVLREFEGHARNIAVSAKQFHDDANQTRQEIDRTTRTEIEESLANLRSLQAWLLEQRTELEAEYTRSLESVSKSGKVFADLAESTTTSLERLPSPVNRLEKLWAGIEALDSRLQGSIGAAAASLGTVGEQSMIAAGHIQDLGNASSRGAGVIDRGAQSMANSLSEELNQLQSLLQDFYSILDGRLRTLR